MEINPSIHPSPNPFVPGRVYSEVGEGAEAYPSMHQDGRQEHTLDRLIGDSP